MDLVDDTINVPSQPENDDDSSENIVAQTHKLATLRQEKQALESICCLRAPGKHSPKNMPSDSVVLIRVPFGTQIL